MPWSLRWQLALRQTLDPGKGLSAFLSRVSIVGIALAIALLLAVQSVMNGFDKEMRERIDGLCGGRHDVRELWVGTFHSICARILRRNADGVGLSSHYAIYDTSDQRSLMKQVLAELGVENEEVLGVLNKVDQLDDPAVLAELQAEFAQSVAISAVTGEGLPALADAVIARRSGDWTELNLFVPHAQARLAALIHEHGEVLEGAWADDGWHARVSLPRAVVWQVSGCVVQEG